MRRAIVERRTSPQGFTLLAPPGAAPRGEALGLAASHLRFTLSRLQANGSRALSWGAKRGMDVVGSAAALLLLSPIFAVAAIIIKASDRGPVLHWQTRVGKGGRVFRFPKFRSMVVGAEAMTDSLVADNHHGDDGVTFKIPQDPRITRFGRILRKTSIDELPQFWCVLRGDMSLVGPRPPLPREVDRYTPAQRRRLDVIPGLTCIWQVSGRSDIPFERQVEMDLEYIETRTFFMDVKLLFMTIPAVINGRGAY